MRKGEAIYIRLNQTNDTAIRKFATSRGMKLTDAVDFAIESFIRDERIVSMISDMLDERDKRR